MFYCYRAAAGIELDGGSYLIHKIYSDEETLKLVGAACEVLGETRTFQFAFAFHV